MAYLPEPEEERGCLVIVVMVVFCIPLWLLILWLLWRILE